MSKKSYRKITINNEIYLWKIGRKNLEIKTPEGKTHFFDIQDKIQNKEAITPKYIADIIYIDILNIQIPQKEKTPTIEKDINLKLQPKEKTFVIFKHHYDGYGGIYIPILYFISDDAKKTKELYNRLAEQNKKENREMKPYYTTHAINKNEILLDEDDEEDED